MTSNLLDPSDNGPTTMPILDFCNQVKANADIYSHYSLIKLEHYKRKRGVEHEFLVISIIDTKVDGSNPIQVCVERGRGPADRWWHPFSSLGPAKDQISRWPPKDRDGKTKADMDMFKTGRANKLSADRWVHHEEFWLISSLRVTSLSTFAIRDFCLILRVVTNIAPQYNVKNYQCYWFCHAVLALSRKALPGLLGASGPEAARAGKWGDHKITILALERAEKDLHELTKKEEEEESNLEVVTTSSPEVLREDKSDTVGRIVAISRSHQHETKNGDEKAVRGALTRARQEAAWEAGVEAMSPISRAFSKASRDFEEDSISPKGRWDDGSWVVGSQWRPTSSGDTSGRPKSVALNPRW